MRYNLPYSAQSVRIQSFCYNLLKRYTIKCGWIIAIIQTDVFNKVNTKLPCKIRSQRSKSDAEGPLVMMIAS